VMDDALSFKGGARVHKTVREQVIDAQLRHRDSHCARPAERHPATPV
jgi:hypothetical protein